MGLEIRVAGLYNREIDMAPPFTLTRESRIRIDADGHVWHEGERVENPRLEALLAGWIARDEATGRWILKNAMDWCYVQVDGAPMAVRSARVEPDGVVRVMRSDGVEELLSPSLLRVDPEGPVYAWVRGGTLLARFDRAAGFAVLDAASLDGATPTLSTAEGAIELVLLGPGEVPELVREPVGA